jgi:hypothetical protein
MSTADEIHQVGPGLFLWHAYDPRVKAELFSTAVISDAGTLVLDPIPLAKPALAELLQTAPLCGVIITNANHWRASADLAGRFSVPVFAHPDAKPEEAMSLFEPVTHGTRILNTLEVIVIEGAAPAEIALHLTVNDGSLVVGDALINFEPHGFTFLPAKYCSNPKQMRRSIGQLLDYKSERILFAHGTPILSQAHARLQELLRGS